MEIVKNSLGQSHDLIEKVVREGDVVIDATAGNGNDTAFLAGLVGPSGRVYAFDIQKEAIKRTRRRIEDLNLAERVVLIEDGHQNLDRYIDTEVKAVMFNLGYLPKGDHSIGTRGETTTAAIEKAMSVLKAGGVITVVVYYGGDSGFEEKEQVLEYIKGIDSRKFIVMKSEFPNQPNCPPILIIIEKVVNNCAM